MVVQNNKNQITDEQPDISDMPEEFKLDLIDKLKACNKDFSLPEIVGSIYRAMSNPPFGVLWGELCSIHSEQTLDTLLQNDDAYFSAIKAKLEDKNLTATQVMEIEANMPFLHGQIMEYLDNHPIRRYYIKLANIERFRNGFKTVVISKENFELQFMGKFEAAKKCKCGVDWASKLYGDECATCGDKRPVDQ